MKSDNTKIFSKIFLTWCVTEYIDVKNKIVFVLSFKYLQNPDFSIIEMPDVKELTSFKEVKVFSKNGSMESFY